MPAGSTYTPIATTTLGSAAASYTFSAISGSYTDLALVCTTRVTGAVDNDDVLVTLNSDTGSNYSATYLNGNGSTATSGRNTSTSKGYWLYVVGNNAGSSTYTVDVINFNNYSNSTTYKTIISRTANSSNGAAARAGLWRSTAAITSITLNCPNSNLAAGSTFTLYGILSA